MKTDQNPTAQLAAANLEGLREALLSPREIHRDPNGMLDHSAFPVFDEDVSTRLLLKAFGIESAFTLMEHDADLEAMEAYDGNCAAWTPSPPDGEGWLLTLIYDTEDGPCAMFVRELKIAPSRRQHVRPHATSLAEWAAAQAICDHKHVNEALRDLASYPTDYNATCVVRAVLRQVATEAPRATRAQASDDAVELILRDVNELEPADPALQDTICVDVSDLCRIVKRHIFATK
ncbi:hypothetical protein CKY39_12165 [Variovorax boronicumulans]|uniref:Uncharacterized protein n=1 Tax=Variovorax boronicumulans TaxID=436515 RepID=A0A250DHP7_9BURK|nr:hypothetical protein [Variovorax boronicumulans]ATA53888.1 hypothetical protein CKY39_12165 [Variovorax boronicumulans]